MTLPVVRALLEGIVDYAGLFPPARLDMAATVANFARYRAGDHAWMLGRLVVPVARLEEFIDASAGIDGVGDWRISGIAGEDPAGDMERVEEFNRRGGPIVDSIELRVSTPGDVAGFASQAGRPIYIEFPADDEPRDYVRALAAARVRGKMRTGGVTEAAFPVSGQVALFIRTCYSAGVAFKATAGLHHPLRGAYALTYEPDSPRGIMHGFLNVFLTAAFCYNGIGVQDAPRLLDVTDIGRVTFDADGVAWDHYRLSVDEVVTARRRLATSFGSCSFTEPVEGLQQLELI